MPAGVGWTEPARAPRRMRIRRGRVAVLLVLLAAAAFAASGLSDLSSSIGPAATGSRTGVPHDASHRSLGEADGAVPDGTTVWDDGVPGVARLDADLLSALRQAATDASRDGVAFVVDSGWRSRAYQAHLLRDAVAEHGSEAEAARWVATPDTSAHVSGAAVDVGSAASGWLSAHGAAYGLCQIYDNERWHYELRPDARDRGCPARYADPTHDPRMRG